MHVLQWSLKKFICWGIARADIIGKIYVISRYTFYPFFVFPRLLIMSYPLLSWYPLRFRRFLFFHILVVGGNCVHRSARPTMWTLNWVKYTFSDCHISAFISLKVCFKLIEFRVAIFDSDNGFLCEYDSFGPLNKAIFTYFSLASSLVSFAESSWLSASMINDI
jgi:hypothetical protein